MNRRILAGAFASLVIAATIAHPAQASLVYAQLSTSQDEASDDAVGLGAGIATDAIAKTLNVVWSQEVETAARERRVDREAPAARLGTDDTQSPVLDDPALSLADSAPSLAGTLDGATFATAGDHRPVEIGFVPSVSALTTDRPPAHDVDGTESVAAPGNPASLVTSPAMAPPPLLDLRLLPALLGILGATAFGFVATRRRQGKS